MTMSWLLWALLGALAAVAPAPAGAHEPEPVGATSTVTAGSDEASASAETAAATVVTPAPPSAASAPAQRPIVALVPLAPASRAEDGLARVVAAGLEARLGESDAVLLLDGGEVQAALDDLVLQAAHLDAAAARHLARVTGADVVLGGSVRHRGARLEVRLWMARGAQPLTHEVASAATGIELEQSVAAVVGRVLGLGDGALAAGALTSDAHAFDALGRGLPVLLGLAEAPEVSRRGAAVRRQATAARADLEAAHTADPACPTAAAGVALAYGLVGDKAGVKEALGTGAAADARGIALATRARLEVGDGEGALEALRLVVKAHAQRPALQARLASLASLRGRFAEARAALDAYVTLVPRDAFMLAQRSRVLASMGRRDEALADAERARELAADAPAVLRELATRWLEAGRSDDAAHLLGAALRSQPGAVRLRVLLARAYMLGGRDIDAVTEGEKARKALDEDDREYRVLLYMTLAHAWARLGQYDVAIEQLATGRRYGLSSLTEIEADPRLTRFRSDPRYPWGK
jgi:tetratricopeptide (TPR) repeat protein